MGPIRSKEAGCSATTGSGSTAPTTKPYNNVKRQTRLRPSPANVETDSDDDVQFIEEMGPAGADRRSHRPPGPSGRSQRGSTESSKAESKGKGMAPSFQQSKQSHFMIVSFLLFAGPKEKTNEKPPGAAAVEETMVDYYKILELPRNATTVDIKKS